MGSTLDKIDRAILRELNFVNCRLSYRALGTKVGLSPNAVKYRIENLIKAGVIIRFIVLPSVGEMADINNVLAFVRTDGTEDTEEFISRIGESPMVYLVSPLICTQGSAYLVFGECLGNTMQVDLGVFLRSMDGVQHVELHTLLSLIERSKIEFTSRQLSVLQCLLQDPRMKVSEIARRTGMATKTARRVLRELEPRKAVSFSIRLNLSAGGLIDAWVRVVWDAKMISFDDLFQWIHDEYPDDLWWIWISTTDSVMFADFIVNHIEDIEEISRSIRKAPFVKSTSALAASTGYPFVRLSEIMARKIMEQTKR